MNERLGELTVSLIEVGHVGVKSIYRASVCGSDNLNGSSPVTPLSTNHMNGRPIIRLEGVSDGSTPMFTVNGEIPMIVEKNETGIPGVSEYVLTTESILSREVQESLSHYFRKEELKAQEPVLKEWNRRLLKIAPAQIGKMWKRREKREQEENRPVGLTEDDYLDASDAFRY